MSKAAFIGGDWGTSNLRLYLCDEAGQVLERGEGGGASVPDCAGRFAEAVSAWDRYYGVLPAILSGMVGSTIGWKEVPYLECPANPSAIAAAADCFRVDGRPVAILPGLRCTSITGAPDVMRGEETQILGALRLHPELAKGRHVLCMPGTHVKWVELKDGAVVRFQTALSGELFELLRRNSVLARDGGEVALNDAFLRGLNFAQANRDADLLYLVFSTRARVVTGEMPKAEAASYLSGLIVGKDVTTAGGLFDLGDKVPLICSPALGALYARALADNDVDSMIIDGDSASLSGLILAQAEILT